MPASMRPRALPLFVVCCLAVLGACAPADRDEQLADLARWQDQRLAPVDSLTALLLGPDAQVRRAALRAAGLIGRSDVLPAMLAGLTDPSAAVRRQAAFSLGLLGGNHAVLPLGNLLESPDAALREAAAGGLAHQEHDGTRLLHAALHDEPRVAAAAWTSLRHAAGRAPRDSLVAAIRAGLMRSEPDVRWRVLRCAELVPDSSLVAMIAPHTTADHLEVRVHALRALSRHAGPQALDAVLRSADRHGRLGARDRTRLAVHELRALGNLAAPILGADPDPAHDTLAGRAAALLHQRAGAGEEPVAVTALEAMTSLGHALALPDAAADLESLLPVWRLRLVRAAHARLDDPSVAVRAAALTALAALRGPGALDEVAAGLADPDPTVAGSALSALLRLTPGHDQVCDWSADLAARHGPFGVALVLGALPALLDDLEARGRIGGPLTVLPRRLDPGCLPSLAWWLAVQGLFQDDPAARALAAPVLARLPGPASRQALLAAWHTEAADADTRLAIVRALADHEALLAGGHAAFEPRRRECLFFARTDRDPRAADPLADPLASPAELGRATDADASTATAAASAILTAAFEMPDLRLRLAARDAAVRTGLVAPELIPSAASLRETMPATERPAGQPAAAGSDAPTRVRCVTDRGTFEIRLRPDLAPNVVGAFLALIAAGFHDDLAFHRVVPDFVIQGGCPRGDGWGGPGWTLRSEWSQQPFERGTVGLAHAGKDTGGSQWFVCLSPQPHLDGRYTVFGKVTSGLDVLDQVRKGDRYRLEIVR